MTDARSGRFVTKRGIFRRYPTASIAPVPPSHSDQKNAPRTIRRRGRFACGRGDNRLRSNQTYEFTTTPRPAYEPRTCELKSYDWETGSMRPLGEP